MTSIERELLAERAAAVQRHVRRVEERLPATADELQPMSYATDAVILHLWQAIQITIDLAVTACVKAGLGSPPTYSAAFRTLGDHGVIDRELAERLARAAGFRNLLVHAYADLDLRRVHAAAAEWPADLLMFLASLRDRLDTP